jgi:hypothetical protein
MMKGIIIMKNHHNYENKLVYDDFITFLMTFLCIRHKLKSLYENHHK